MMTATITMPAIQAAALVGAEFGKPRSGRRSFVNCLFPVVSVKGRVVSDQAGERGVHGNNEQARVRLRDEARGVDHQAAEPIPAAGERSAYSRKIPADMRGERAANVLKSDHSRRASPGYRRSKLSSVSEGPEGPGTSRPLSPTRRIGVANTFELVTLPR